MSSPHLMMKILLMMGIEPKEETEVKKKILFPTTKSVSLSKRIKLILNHPK